MGISIGQKDEEGNLLILGGWNENLLRTPKGYFKVGKRSYINSGEAIGAYNEANETKLQKDYVETYFKPWYEKKYGGRTTLTVPSSSGDKTYEVSVDEFGNVSCNCPGFMYRGKCRHSDVVKELLEGT